MLSLTLLLGGWTLACCFVYAFLRAIEVTFPFFVLFVGSLALVAWFGLLGMLVFAAGIDPLEHPFMGRNVLVAALVLLLTLGLGRQLLHRATSKRIIPWRGVLFCALYLAGVHLMFGDIHNSWPPLNTIFEYPSITSPHSGIAATLFVWFFPLGAPITEIFFHQLRSMRRELS